MKKWLIPVASMIAVFATAGTVAGFALAGGGSDAADRPESEGPPTSSAVCAQDVPDCNDTIVVPNGGAGTGDELDGDVLPPDDRSDDGTSGDVPSIDPAIEVVPEPGIAVGEPHPGIPPNPAKDLNPCEPGQSLAVSSNGEYACYDEGSAPTGGSVSSSTKVGDDDSVSVNHDDVVNPPEPLIPALPDDSPDYGGAGDEVLAPIDQVEVLIKESFPVQYAVRVVSGLPNSCIEFGRISWERDGEVIRISIINDNTTEDGLAACAMVYGYVESIVELGTDFEPGTTYYLLVNDVKESFLAQ